jgi:hypothetical protein
VNRPSFDEVATALAETAGRWSNRDFTERSEAVRLTLECPNTFTPEAIAYAVDTVMPRITIDGLRHWIDGRRPTDQETVAVLNAGNVPFVGLQDLLAVIAVGHRYCGVLSSKSPHLLPAFSRTLTAALSGISIEFDRLQGALAKADRLLATGADSTISAVSSRAARAGIHRPRQLCRGTRFSVGVMDGRESQGERLGIALDAILHEGRGCLNASVLFVPMGFSASDLAMDFSRVRDDFPPHAETLDALDYEERLLAATGQRFTAGSGFILVEGDPSPRRPGVVVLTAYRKISEVEDWIQRNESLLQTVIVSKRVVLDIGAVGACEPGSSQDPPLDWRPDRIDVVEFLTER